MQDLILRYARLKLALGKINFFIHFFIASTVSLQSFVEFPAKFGVGKL